MKNINNMFLLALRINLGKITQWMINTFEDIGTTVRNSIFHIVQFLLKYCIDRYYE